MFHLSLNTRALCTLSVATALGAIPAAAGNRLAHQPPPEPRGDMASIFFIREPHFQGSGRTMFVYLDEEFLGVLDNNSYFHTYAPPGKHLLWMNWAKVSADVEWEAGETYYYNTWTGFDEVGEQTGKAMIEGVKAYVEPTDKERDTAAKHIEERYDKAQRVAEKRPEREEYVGTKSKREEHVARWGKVDLAAYSVLYVEPFEMTDPKAKNRKKEHLVEYAPIRLAEQIVENLEEGVFEDIRVGVPDTPAPGALVLRGQITQYKPGSETARLMLAGTGSSHLDFQAQLFDAVSGQKLSELDGERTWAWGGVMGASRDIGSLEKNVAYEIALYLERCRGMERAEADE